MTRSSYLRVLKDPFNVTPCHIPDAIVAESGVLTSRWVTTFIPTATSGTSTVHNGGFIVGPYPKWTLLQLYESVAGGGTLSDLNGAGSNWVGSGPSNVPNISGFYAGSTGAARVRPIAIGVRLTYEGSELNRSGRIYAGLCPVSLLPVGGAASVFPLSALSAICMGATTTTIGNLRQCVVDLATARVGDGTFEARWFPTTTPTYQQITAGQGEVAVAPGANQPVQNSVFNSPDGGVGWQSGQNVLVVWVEGDTTSSLQSTGNTFGLEIICHWECIPTSPSSVAYSLSPSICNMAELAAALNSIRQYPMGEMTKATTVVQGSHNGIQTTRKAIQDYGVTPATEGAKKGVKDAVRQAAQAAATYAAGEAIRRVAGAAVPRMPGWTYARRRK